VCCALTWEEGRQAVAAGISVEGCQGFRILQPSADVLCTSWQCSLAPVARELQSFQINHFPPQPWEFAAQVEQGGKGMVSPLEGKMRVNPNHLLKLAGFSLVLLERYLR